MSNDREYRLLELIDGALAIEPQLRATWLDQACLGDAQLRSDAEAMLACAENAEALLAVAAWAGPEAAGVAPGHASLDHEIRGGSQIGDFLVEQQVGSGGMGIVYRARQLSLNRTVALKVLPHWLSGSEAARARFRREVEAAANLDHAHIVSVHATGEEAGRLYYAMEFISGPTLSQFVRSLQLRPIAQLTSVAPRVATLSNRGTVADTQTMSQAVDRAEDHDMQHADTDNPEHAKATAALLKRCDGDYFDQIALALADVADALEYAHQNQIIHRDVKPSNLLICPRGNLHIGDFGLARSLQAPSLTRTGECVGTPLYMAPEQISAGEMPIDHRVDVYGLGATLYELLTLRPPFTAENREQVLTKIAERSPIPPRRINRRVPRDLQTICLKALEKRPGDRYQSAADMASDLRAFVARYSISAKPAGPLTLAMKWTQRHRVLCIWIGVATVLAAAAIGLGLRTRQLEARWTSARQQQVFEGALMAALEGKIEDATAAVDSAEHLGAPPDRIHLLQGQVELMAGNPEVAHEHFERAAEMMPDSVTAQALLAYSCLTRQQYDRGERLVQHLDQLTPVTLEDYLFKARAEAFFDPEAAAETLDRAVERGRRSLVARLIRGEVQTTRAMDNADPTLAKAALDDYQLAHEMLGATPLVSMNYLRALLVASTTYEVCGMLAERDAVLKRAAQISAELAAVDTAPAHHRRALYLDYIGRDQEAIDEWHKIQDKNVLFQAITLLRLGRLDEAAALGDQFGGQQSPDRMMTFIAALIAAATSDSAEDFAGRFPLEAEQPMSAIHELLAVYTVSCLTGQPAVARREALRLKQEGRFPTMLHRWYRRLEEYACQEITADQLLEFAGPSRKKQCEGHYYIGMTELCKGDREAAWQHFRASSALRVFTFYEYHLSRAMAAQLERDPTWPAWIPRQPL